MDLSSSCNRNEMFEIVCAKMDDLSIVYNNLEDLGPKLQFSQKLFKELD